MSPAVAGAVGLYDYVAAADCCTWLPRFVARFAELRAVDVLLPLDASAFAIYGVYATFGSATT